MLYGLLSSFAFAPAEPLEFGIDPDTAELVDVDQGGANERDAQLQSLMVFVDMSVEENDVFSFTDEDGEQAFFRAGDVSMITVPLATSNRKLFETERKGYKEERYKEEQESEDSGD